jgi:AT-rich interactive domain-containing protein 1
MGDEADRQEFLKSLFSFMEERGTPIVAVPTISKMAIDLYGLYHIVRDFGGMIEVGYGPIVVK